MAEVPRLNNVIRAWEDGKPAFTSFAQAEVETAVAMSTSKFDGVVYEMEHNFWDARALRDAIQYMLNRRQIVQSGTLAPAVTPMVRIPPNGGEQPMACQAGPRSWRLRRVVAAHLDSRSGPQRRRGLPLPALEDRPAL